MFRCPQCKRSDRIEIAAHVWVSIKTAALTWVAAHDDDNVETEVSETDGSHEWDDDSAARCLACGASGTVLTFTDEE